jgi:hypothetical protein
VIAATGLVVVIARGITLLVVRVRGDGVRRRDDAAAVAAPEHESPRPLVNAPATVAAPGHREATAPAIAPPAAAAAPPAEVPEWERKPLRTSQPFPEEARFDPPMPPIKIPPEMLIPPAAPDAR